MTLELPNQIIVPPVGADLTPEELAEFFGLIQENFESLSQMFPLSGANLADEVLRIAGKHTANFGEIQLAWPGEEEISSATLVVHGLVGTPKIWVSGEPTSAGKLSLPYFYTPTGTSFSVRAYSPFKPAASETSNVSWLALI